MYETPFILLIKCFFLSSRHNIANFLFLITTFQVKFRTNLHNFFLSSCRMYCWLTQTKNMQIMLHTKLLHFLFVPEEEKTFSFVFMDIKVHTITCTFLNVWCVCIDPVVCIFLFLKLKNYSYSMVAMVNSET